MTDDTADLDLDSAWKLAAGLTALLEAARHRITTGTGSELVTRITGHVGCALADMPNVSTPFDNWEHVNLHLGVAAYVERHSPGAEWFGITGDAHGHQDLLDMLAMAERHDAFQLGPVDYTTQATGPDTALDVIQLGLVRTRSAGGHPVVLAVRGPMEHSPHPRCVLRVLAADQDTATEVRTELELLVRDCDVYGGQLLSFDVSEYRGNELVSFLPRPELTEHDVVLPTGVLAAIEKHVVRNAGRSRLLREHGQHLKRGVLLYGPPGTGKTHTARYLMSRLTGVTVLVLAGRALTRLLPTAVSMARRLQPSVVVVEDVDLVAEDRHRPQGGTPVLFELLNRIDGIDSDTDVTFVLTTNRVHTIELALADRPGRVDLAVEIPKPDAAGREALLRLYAERTELDLPDAGALVADTEGVTASFVRELVRRAVSAELDRDPAAERVRLTEPALRAALTELQDQRNALTRSILGGTTPTT